MRSASLERPSFCPSSPHAVAPDCVLDKSEQMFARSEQTFGQTEQIFAQKGSGSKGGAIYGHNYIARRGGFDPASVLSKHLVKVTKCLLKTSKVEHSLAGPEQSIWRREPRRVALLRRAVVLSRSASRSTPSTRLREFVETTFALARLSCI